MKNKFLEYLGAETSAMLLSEYQGMTDNSERTYYIASALLRGDFGETGVSDKVIVISTSCKKDPIVACIIAWGYNHKTKKWTAILATDHIVMYKPDIQAITAKLGLSFRTIDCLYEKSCGAVVYTGDKNRKYLLIKNLSGHIGFPKGHIEYRETEQETAKREILEETGLLVTFDPSFREEYDYRIGKYIHKKGVYYLARFAESDSILLKKEEIKEKWLLEYPQALETLNMENDRQILNKAENYLNDKMKNKI